MVDIVHGTLTDNNVHAAFPHGDIANIPASPTNLYNNFYFADDENKLYFHNGSSWIEFAMDIDLSNATNTAISFMKANSAPITTIIMSPLANPPTGYLLCDGSAISRTSYADLFTALGTLYGAGDGSTTFNLPDFRGCFLRGYDGMLSAAVGTSQADGLPNITGTFQGTRSSGQSGYKAPTGAFTKSASGLDSYNTGGADMYNISFDASLSNSIYGNSNYVTPLNHAIYYFIKY